ncbi:MAG: hypothetical protein JRG81_11475 [Deltaproteobacteria bacterium]|nr:hypothetical protein [Deltaproteobacteria bacterium]MBW2180970.1 hypothetical protein [Deltaproteobacteria bacterium]
MIPILLLGILIGSMLTAISLFLWGEINNKIDEISEVNGQAKNSWSLTRIKE